MLSALIYLRLTSFKNWTLQRLRALRRPKQLAGTIAFAVYFYVFFLRNLGRTSIGRQHAAGTAAANAMAAAGVVLPTDWLPLATAIAACALLFFTTLMWIVPTQRAALGFTEPEIAFLFPAPVTRRALVHFRLLSGQFRSLVGATVMMLISNRWSFLGGDAVTHALGWWFVFSGLNLHYSGANFTLTRRANRGLGTMPCRALVALVVGGGVALTFWRLPAAGRFPVLDELHPFTDWITRLTSTAPLGWLLWPFRFVAAPFLAPSIRSFLLALGPALLVIGLHYLWVVNAAVAFEDASLAYAEKRGARIAAWRSGQRRLGSAPMRAQRDPFRLTGAGRAELAFLWKNLLSTWPYFRWRTFAYAVIALLVAASWLRHFPDLRPFLAVLGTFAGIFGLYLLVIGPQFARQDIRGDLTNADLLKTYPLPGWQIVLGELLTPVAILTGLLWLALLAAGLAFVPLSARLAWLTPQLRVVLVCWLAVIIPPLVTLQVLVPNAAALVFPSWFQASRSRGGPEVAGQRMIFFFAQLLVMVAALLPAAGFAALVVFVLQHFFGGVAAVSIAGSGILLLIIGEVWCAVWLLGQRFEQLDLSAELGP